MPWAFSKAMRFERLKHKTTIGAPKTLFLKVCYLVSIIMFIFISIILVKETSIFSSNAGSTSTSLSSLSSFFDILPSSTSGSWFHPFIIERDNSIEDDTEMQAIKNNPSIASTAAKSYLTDLARPSPEFKLINKKDSSKKQVHVQVPRLRTASTKISNGNLSQKAAIKAAKGQKDSAVKQSSITKDDSQDTPATAYGPRFYSFLHLSKLRKHEDDFTSRNVIIGLVEDIDVVYLKIFAASLRKSSNKTTEVIIFINEQNIDSRVVQIAKEYAIWFVYFNRISLGKIGPSNLRAFHPSSLRYVLFVCLLTNHNCNFGKDLDYKIGMERNTWLVKAFDNVLLVDVRDSFFQDDPFKICTPTVRKKTEAKRVQVDITPTEAPSEESNSNSIETSVVKPIAEGTIIKHTKWVYQTSVVEIPIPNLCNGTFYSGKETRSGKLGASGFNSNFITSCFSDAMLSLLKNQEIICSGVSLGDSVKVSQYIYLMANILVGKSQMLSVNPKCPEKVGVDQGVHNLIMALEAIKGAKLIAELIDADANIQVGSPFINLLGSETHLTHYENKDDVTQIQNYHVDHSQGNEIELFPIVHEYDRISSLLKHLITRHAPWVNVNNNSLSSIEIEPACVLFNVSVRGDDPLTGKYDLSSKMVLTPGQCCSLCNDQRMSWLKRIRSINTYSDYEKILSTEEKSILTGNMNKLPNGTILMNKHSRKYYMTNSERFKICTSFTFVDFNCFLKFASLEHANLAYMWPEAGEVSADSSNGGGDSFIVVDQHAHESKSVSESQKKFAAFAAAHSSSNINNQNSNNEEKSRIVVTGNLKPKFFSR